MEDEGYPLADKIRRATAYELGAFGPYAAAVFWANFRDDAAANLMGDFFHKQVLGIDVELLGEVVLMAPFVVYSVKQIINYFDAKKHKVQAPDADEKNVITVDKGTPVKWREEPISDKTSIHEVVEYIARNGRGD